MVVYGIVLVLFCSKISVHYLVLLYKCNKCNLMCLQDPSHAAFKEKMKEFMANFDKNSDGKIEMSEVRTVYQLQPLWCPVVVSFSPILSLSLMYSMFIFILNSTYILNASCFINASHKHETCDAR